MSSVLTVINRQKNSFFNVKDIQYLFVKDISIFYKRVKDIYTYVRQKVRWAYSI